eukprot:jgi/Botrbrau1/21944/Bobra.0249s0067.1
MHIHMHTYIRTYTCMYVHIKFRECLSMHISCWGARHTMSAVVESPCAALFVPARELYMLGTSCLEALKAVHQKRVQCRTRAEASLGDPQIPSIDTAVSVTPEAPSPSKGSPRQNWVFDDVVRDSCEYLEKCKGLQSRSKYSHCI